MDPVVAFLLEHWQLSGAFVFVVVLILANELRHRVFGIKEVSPQELVDLLNHQNATALDVRTAAQFAQGHILSALHFPLSELSEGCAKLENYKSHPIIIVCASGLETSKAGKILKTAGFTQIYGLAGGMQAWESQQLPVVR